MLSKPSQMAILASLIAWWRVHVQLLLLQFLSYQGTHFNGRSLTTHRHECCLIPFHKYQSQKYLTGISTILFED